jgi:hypothetical protein
MEFGGGVGWGGGRGVWETPICIVFFAFNFCLALKLGAKVSQHCNAAETAVAHCPSRISWLLWVCNLRNRTEQMPDLIATAS